MTDNELQKLVTDISLTTFHQPFKHRAFFNNRLRTTGGRYQLQSHDIDINPRMLTEHDMTTLIGVVKHELCHYHLHLHHLGYQHRDRDFKKLLSQVGGLRYAPAGPKTRRKKTILTYQCQDCGLVFQRQRHINLQKYRCGRCRGKLHLIQETHGVF